jgi:hypothetical protein
MLMGAQSAMAQFFDESSAIKIESSRSSGGKELVFSGGHGSFRSNPIPSELDYSDKDLTSLVNKANLFSMAGLFNAVPTQSPLEFTKNPTSAIREAIDRVEKDKDPRKASVVKAINEALKLGERQQCGAKSDQGKMSSQQNVR